MCVLSQACVGKKRRIKHNESPAPNEHDAYDIANSKGAVLAGANLVVQRLSVLETSDFRLAEKTNPVCPGGIL